MKEYRNTLLISPTDVKDLNFLNLNVSDESVASAIHTAQEVYLLDILGSNLLDRVKELVYGSIKQSGETIDDEANEAYLILLDEYIVPYLAVKSTAELCKPISFKIRNVGVAQDSDTNIYSSTYDDIEKLRKVYETEVAERATLLSKFLCQFKSAFSELEGDGEVPARIGERFANTALWLGGNKKGKCGCGR